jgi:hypothetical protein
MTMQTVRTLRFGGCDARAGGGLHAEQGDRAAEEDLAHHQSPHRALHVLQPHLPKRLRDVRGGDCRRRRQGTARARHSAGGEEQGREGEGRGGLVGAIFVACIIVSFQSWHTYNHHNPDTRE